MLEANACIRFVFAPGREALLYTLEADEEREHGCGIGATAGVVSTCVLSFSASRESGSIASRMVAIRSARDARVSAALRFEAAASAASASMRSSSACNAARLVATLAESALLVIFGV